MKKNTKKNTKKDYILLEEYCCECDEVLNAVVSAEDFCQHKVGRIRCSCRHVNLPCNQCDDHDACGDCPWKKAKVVKAMTDEEYIRFIRDNEPELYRLFKSGDNGDYYKDIIEKVEKEG